MDFEGAFEDLSSRAFPNDVDASINSRLETEFTSQGQDLKTSIGPDHILCVFSGRSSQKFATNYVKSQAANALLLWRTFLVPAEPETTDEYELKRGKQSVLSVFKLNQVGIATNVLFAIFDSKFELGHFFIQQIVNEYINNLLQSAPVTYIFQSEPSSKFYSNNADYGQSENFCLTSSRFSSKSELVGLVRLPMPNLVAGFGAAVLTQCEKQDKSCLHIVNYVDNPDTLHLPFVNYIQSSPQLKSSLNLSLLFNGSSRGAVDQSNLFT